MIFVSRSDRGKIRKVNEDQIYLPEKQGEPLVIIVADGMGGHNAGDVASNTAVAEIVDYLKDFETKDITEQNIRHAIIKANNQVLRKSMLKPEYTGMGTTITLAVLKDDMIIIGQVGDSRAYVYKNNKLKLETKDHSYVQHLIDNGNITEQEARVHPQRNIITRAVGLSTPVEVDTYTVKWKIGDSVMLCSDGLTQHLSDDDLSRILKETKSLKKAAKKMEQEALNSGGTDNISIVIAKNSEGSDSN